MVTIGQFQVTRSITIGSPVQIRSNTIRYFHHKPMRSVAIGYDCGRDVFQVRIESVLDLSYDWTPTIND